MGPSIQGNIQVDNLVSTVDILPTLADLAGVKSVDNVDGRSLVPLLTNSAQVSGWRESIFAELPHIDNTWPWKSTPPSYQLMRTQKFKYIEYETGEREYYDLVNDPNEMENLYNTLSPETQTNLSLELRKLAEGRQ
jgi:arylsulfatase A-like enzyme